MGGSSSKPVEIQPKGPLAPDWLNEIKLVATNTDENPLLREPPKLKYYLPEHQI